MKKLIFGAYFLCFSAFGAPTQEIPSRELPPAEQLEAFRLNAEAERQFLKDSLYSSGVERPFAEYEEVGVVIFSSARSGEAENIKYTIANELSPDVHLIVTANDSNDILNSQNYFRGVMKNPKNLHVIEAYHSGMFWSRDTSAVPAEDSQKELNIINTLHYGNGVAGHKISNFLQVPLIPSSFRYPGGNFVADRKGNCFQNQGARVSLSHEALRSMYGCQNPITIPQAHGIGDIDEELRILSDDVALTDVPSRRPLLESLGYDVKILPRPSGNPHGTYANSLIVNGKAFVPIYGVSEDSTALEVYRSSGFKVFPLRSNSLSANSRGSIHCMTMAYPPVDIPTLISHLQGDLR